MEVGQLQRRWIEFISSLFHEGFLDDQFAQLQQLQDESNPDFVFEVVTLFFDDSEKLLNDLGRALDQQVVDFRRVDGHVHQLKGSSSSIGAQRVKNVCITFRNFCDENNREGCVRCLQEVKHECSLVKNKLESLFRADQEGTRERYTAILFLLTDVDAGVEMNSLFQKINEINDAF